MIFTNLGGENLWIVNNRDGFFKMRRMALTIDGAAPKIGVEIDERRKPP